MAEKKLTPKQRRFCEHYATHWNATRAAIQAGYSEKSAAKIGFDLLKNPLVQARVKELSEHALKEIGVTRERVLSEYACIAFLDPAEAYDEIGQLKPIKEMREEVRRAVAKIKVFEVFSPGPEHERILTGFTKEVEFSSKKGALDSLNKCLGMSPDRVEHSGPGGKPIVTENHQISDETRERLELLRKDKPEPTT